MREFRLLRADIAELRELFIHHLREDRLLSARQVSERTTLSPAEIRRREIAGTFGELRVALQWCRDNPQRRKTARGMLRFLGSWLQRANDRGRMAKKATEPEEVPEPRWTRHDLRFDGRLAEEGGKRFSAYFGEQVPEGEWRPFGELEAELGPCAGEVFRG